MAGRPPIKRHGERPETWGIKIKFTPTERAMLQRAAEELETDESEFCRIAAVRAAERHLDMSVVEFQRVRKKEMTDPRNKADGQANRPNGHT